MTPSEIEELEARIMNLPRQDLARLRDWFLDLDDQLWDQQIAADFKAQCLRALGRTEEELDARVEALGQFALTEDPESVPQFSIVPLISTGVFWHASAGAFTTVMFTHGGALHRTFTDAWSFASPHSFVATALTVKFTFWPAVQLPMLPVSEKFTDAPAATEPRFTLPPPTSETTIVSASVEQF